MAFKGKAVDSRVRLIYKSCSCHRGSTKKEIVRGGLHGAVAAICMLPDVCFMLGEAVINGIALIWCGGVAGFVTYGGFTFTSGVQ